MGRDPLCRTWSGHEWLRNVSILISRRAGTIDTVEVMMDLRVVDFSGKLRVRVDLRIMVDLRVRS